MTFFHGILVQEPTDGARPILETSTAVIGLVATATADPGAATAALNAAFPLDRPVLITDVQRAVALAGSGGTLGPALQQIANQGSPLVVVVRVAPGVAGNGQTEGQATNANVIGGVVGGSYGGMQALLVAEQIVGVRPRILGAPGLDSTPVRAAMVIVAKRLRAMVYAAASGATVVDAVTDRGDYSARELCLIWPASANSGRLVAAALGLRAMTDERIGWHKSLSNVTIAGITQLGRDVTFDIRDASTDAGVLNTAQITTVVRLGGGFRFWGNRTCSDEPLFAFETATRTAQAIQDVIADGLSWAVDKPMTLGLIRDLLETGNARLRQWTYEGRLIGASMWYDPSLNPADQLAAGKLVIDYDFTPVAPLEGLQLNQRITDRYYADFGDLLTAA